MRSQIELERGQTVSTSGPDVALMSEAIEGLKSHALDAQRFVDFVAHIPAVHQNPLPSQPFWDSWTRVEGPLAELGKAFDHGDIPADVHDAALDAMIKAGHEA